MTLTKKGRERAVLAGVGDAVADVTTYIMLLASLPADPHTATLADYAAGEIVDGGYSRQSITWALNTTGSEPVAENNAIIEFGPFANAVTIAHVALCTTPSGTSGDVLAYWTLSSSVSASAGDYVRFGVGDISIASA